MRGLLAMTIVRGYSARKGNKEEAFKIVNEQPFGQVALVVIGISLLGYLMPRFYQAFTESNHKGKKVNALLKDLVMQSAA